MKKHFVSIWFPYLTTDWLSIRRPALRQVPFVFAAPIHGRMLITAVNPLAKTQGVSTGMVVADAKAFVPGLEVFNDRPQLAIKLLKAIGFWCIRYTPIVALDGMDGLILDSSGCTHLWGGESTYLNMLKVRLKENGYHVQLALANTIGAAWAMARFTKESLILENDKQRKVLLTLPPAALRLEADTVRRLHKLGLKTIGSFMGMPQSVLRRRFGEELSLRLRQAFGQEEEFISPLKPLVPYEERLPCLEPICTATGIETALQRLLETLCKRLNGEGKGLREAVLTSHRVDGKILRISICTSKASAHIPHLFKLFALQIPKIEPELGIELFVLEALKVEKADSDQETLWAGTARLENKELSELLDRLTGKTGNCTICRYLPDEHYWPERATRQASFIGEQPNTVWPNDKPRPTRLLATPEPIEVTAPIPDYPPMVFRYKGAVHPVKKADGPERIEREWWIDAGEHRDYYAVEDDQGRRYWLFRSGHYEDGHPQRWYIHGFFA